MTSTRKRIQRLLRTAPGERVMRPTYGSNLYQLADKRHDDGWVRDCSHAIYEAISEHEPKIGLKQVKIITEKETVKAEITLKDETLSIAL